MVIRIDSFWHLLCSLLIRNYKTEIMDYIYLWNIITSGNVTGGNKTNMILLELVNDHIEVVCPHDDNIINMYDDTLDSFYIYINKSTFEPVGVKSVGSNRISTFIFKPIEVNTHVNVKNISTWLYNLGIKLDEVRIIPDIEIVIVNTVN